MTTSFDDSNLLIIITFRTSFVFICCERYIDSCFQQVSRTVLTWPLAASLPTWWVIHDHLVNSSVRIAHFGSPRCDTAKEISFSHLRNTSRLRDSLRSSARDRLSCKDPAGRINAPRKGHNINTKQPVVHKWTTLFLKAEAPSVHHWRSW